MDSTDRSLPRHSTKGSKRSRANSTVDVRLSVIAEDGVLPQAPEKSRNNRTFSRGWAFNPPRHSFEESPPNYSFWDVTGPKGEKLTDVRNNKYIARRGGWRRICLITLVAIAMLVALAVGLGVGLRKKHSDPPVPPSPSASSAENTTFPIGTWTLNVHLDSIKTNCTSNATTWRCPPYQTYDHSPSESAATFIWVISPSAPGSPTDLSISTTNNPFAIEFSNASLQLVDRGLQTERYQFSVPVDKQVAPLHAPNVNCYYKGTTLEGNMYTRLTQIFPNMSSTNTVSSAAPTSTPISYVGGQQNWPYAVNITQSIHGGADVPDCYRMNNGTQVEQLTLGLEPRVSTDICSCHYQT